MLEIHPRGAGPSCTTRSTSCGSCGRQNSPLIVRSAQPPLLYMYPGLTHAGFGRYGCCFANRWDAHVDDAKPHRSCIVAHSVWTLHQRGRAVSIEWLMSAVLLETHRTVTFNPRGLILSTDVWSRFPIWSHEVDAVKDPSSGRYVAFYSSMAHGKAPPCAACTDGSTSKSCKHVETNVAGHAALPAASGHRTTTAFTPNIGALQTRLTTNVSLCN